MWLTHDPVKALHGGFGVWSELGCIHATDTEILCL